MEALRIPGDSTRGWRSSLVTSSPPGLGRPMEAIEELAGEDLPEAFAQGGAACGDQGAEVLSEAALRVIDARVAGKWEELWRRGTQAVNQMQRSQNDRIEALEKQVNSFKDRQLCLETENDKLRHTVVAMAARFANLGAAFQGPLLPTNTSTSSAAPPMTPRQLEASPLPGQQSMASIHGVGGSTVAAPGLGASLPEVPAFPLLGPSPASPAQPFSLVSSLGLASSPLPPQARTPVALAPRLLTPSRGPEASPNGVPFFPFISTPVASPTPAQPGPAGSFTITLRKADGVDLGLDVVAQEQVLLVCDVVPDGAVEAWNRQCLNRQNMERMVHVGDQIITVNNMSQDTLRMMEECRASQLLKLCLLHGDTDGADSGPLASPLGGTPGGTAASFLRAEADVFVPRGDNETGVQPGAAAGELTTVEETASSDAAATGPVQRV